jgi:hypothetical protein
MGNHRVSNVGVAALSCDKNAACENERLHFLRAGPHAIRWHEEKFEQVGVGRSQQINESQKTEIDDVLALVGKLSCWRVQFQVRSCGERVHTPDVFITFLGMSSVGSTTRDAREEDIPSRVFQ